MDRNRKTSSATSEGLYFAPRPIHALLQCRRPPAVAQAEQSTAPPRPPRRAPSPPTHTPTRRARPSTCMLTCTPAPATMLSLGAHGAPAQRNPLDVTCGSVKTYFKDAGEGEMPDKSLGYIYMYTYVYIHIYICIYIYIYIYTTSAPHWTQISYPAKEGVFSPCPPKEVYYKCRSAPVEVGARRLLQNAPAKAGINETVCDINKKRWCEHSTLPHRARGLRSAARPAADPCAPLDPPDR